MVEDPDDDPVEDFLDFSQPVLPGASGTPPREAKTSPTRSAAEPWNPLDLRGRYDQEMQKAMDNSEVAETLPADREEDANPADPEALMTGGPAGARMLGVEEEEGQARPDGAEDFDAAIAAAEAWAEGRPHTAAAAAAGTHLGAAEEEGAESDASDVEVGLRRTDGLRSASWEEDLPEEHWQTRPPRERELWERARPRALRREAATVRSQRLPVAALNRIMKLHPDLHTRSAEALDVINCATVLLLQAVTQSGARSKSALGQRVIQFEDVRQACLSAKELQFLLPLSSTMDASALKTKAVTEEADGAQQPRGQPPAGQKQLDASSFACRAGGQENVPPPAPDAESGGEGTPARPGRAKKRKEPPSSEKASSKAAKKAAAGRKAATPQRSAADGSSGGAGIRSFFRRVADAAA
eukprot:gnl/TRDRNA2_/TRDRNA2_68122_c0_seq1.p1 gnl/TRDRNA2_/TRDRNA2_68122_c0~~gnl/TRDRNA2_/TRDRNA2_68122_c0_seq1.p1  ORF type:complete len:412 (-),score=90.96 gnl/TRDRNA2_/TRDRNA2_68122_c0_seq1:72-1307(-)